jgi:hypothetical protein
MKHSIRRFAIPLAALLFVACDDISPLDYQAPVSDAGEPDADPEQIAACMNCLNGEQGACRAQYDTCSAAHPLCRPMGDCFTQANCWGQLDLANIANLPACALRCYDEVGLRSLNDIAAPATPVFVCLISDPTCAAACFGTAAVLIGDSDAGADASTGL